jgi:hypothetical protein
MGKRITALAATFILGWGVAKAKATVILSEDFSEYANTGSLQTVYQNNNLQTTDNPNGTPEDTWTNNVTLNSYALSFGSLATSGASMSVVDPNYAYGEPGVGASRSLGPGASTFDSSNPTADPYYQSAIWSSYLIAPTSTVYPANPYGSPGSSLGAFFSQSNGSGHELVSNPAFSPSYYGTQQFTGEQNQAGTPAYTVSAGNTYLVISNLDVNGIAYAYTGQTVTATEYLFTVTAFNNWVAAGKDPASLGTFAVSTAGYTYTGDNYGTTFGFSTLDSSSLINFQTYAGSADFGDLLVGTTLADVTPTPEPGTTAVLGAIVWFTIGRRQRRMVA